MSKKKNLNPPLIYEIDSNDESLKKFINYMEQQSDEKKRIILNYPTVYLYNYNRRDKYEIYVGETSNMIRRTFQHLHLAHEGKDKWQKMLNKSSAKMFIMGHNHFNKSLTLDIEHRLMLYMSSVEKVKKVHNRRGNIQNEYYTSDEFEEVFSEIWKKLGGA